MGLFCNQQGSAADSWIKRFRSCFSSHIVNQHAKALAVANFKFHLEPPSTPAVQVCPRRPHGKILYPGAISTSMWWHFDVYDGIATQMSDPLTRFFPTC